MLSCRKFSSRRKLNTERRILPPGGGLWQAHTMHRTTRLKVTNINQHFVCILCDGYLIDATTIVECLHSFCRTCIVRYLENSSYCPVCDVQVHKTKPLQSIRSDTTLQDVVYKLIPGLYQNEMQRRREFYSEHPEAAAKCSTEERGEGAEQRCFYSPKENISLTLEYFHGSDNQVDLDSENSADKLNKDFLTRHLNCPAALSVANIKKFVRMKFSIPLSYAIKMLYSDHLLIDEYTLMDIAYIYSWRRAGPMKFLYTFVHCKSTTKRSLGATLTSASLEQVPNLAVNESTSIDSEPNVIGSSSCENPPTFPDESIKMETDETNDSANDDKFAAITDCSAKDRLGNTEAAVPLESSASSEQMEVVEPEPPTPNPSSSPKETTEPASRPNVQVTQVVCAPQNTIVATTNGIKLKLIHCPEPDSKTRSKKSTGRKGGRTRYKSAPVQNRFPRLAPYPPPHTTACLTTPNIAPLSPLTMGKLVPSVMTSLSSNLVTALVSNTANTLCNVTKNSTILPPTPFLSQSPLNVVTCNVTTQQITCPVTTHSNSYASRIPRANSPMSSTTTTKLTSAISTVPCSSYVRGLTSTHVITIPPTKSPATVSPPISGSTTAVRDLAPVTGAALKPLVPLTNISSASVNPLKIPSSLSVPAESRNATVSQTIPVSNVTVVSARSSTPVNSPLSLSSVSKEKSIPSTEQCFNSLPSATLSVPKPAESLRIPEQAAAKSLGSPPSILKSALSDNKLSASKKLFLNTTAIPPEGKVACNGIATSHSPSTKDSALRDTSRCPEKTSNAFEMSVKNSISAEFSDTDDLGCQPDLVVDEQKMDSSDNEDDTDAALRKKITAIAEKEDEADDGDSGRASDISSQARSSCDDDIGSPMNAAPSSELILPISLPSQLSIFPAPVTTSTTTSDTSHRNIKSNNINHVINNLHKHHEKKDPFGALDLSTCPKKPGEGSSRPKPVANPVLDIKHRQQTYLPAPSKQHTACVPSPKHPTTSPILMHGLTGHHSLAVPSQPPAVHGKSPHLPVPHFHNTPMVFSSQSRAISTPSIAGRSTPTYSNTSHAMSPPVPSAHQGLPPMLPGMISCMNAPVLSSFPIRGAAAGVMTARCANPASHLKGIATPPQNPYSKVSNIGKLSGSSSSIGSRKSQANSDSHHAKALSTPNNRNSSTVSPSFTPGSQASYPKSSLTNMKMSPHHRSASPAPSPKPMVPTTNVSAPSATTSPSHKSNQSIIPMYKKSSSSSNSYKSFNSKYKGSNFSVINPDPNGNLHKLVIRNLDVRPNNNHQSQKS